MPRVLRNYLISFALIGLFFGIVHAVNRCVEERTAPSPPPAPAAPAGVPRS